MQFSEVSRQPPSTQHAPYLSCAFGELGGEARAPRSDGADWQGGRQVPVELRAACGCPQMAGLAGLRRSAQLVDSLVCPDTEGLS